jgi:hypothetical protein
MLIGTIGALFDVKLGISAGLGILLGIILSSGLKSGQMTVKMIPNQGIHKSAKNSIIAGLLACLPFWLMGRWMFGEAGGVILGLVAGLIFGLIGGGEAVIKHYLLRFILWLNNDIPWNVGLFLDFASERIILRKVGGGYIFIHRYLQEYYASLELEE